MLTGTLTGKVAFVAGASRGVGAAVAMALAQQGAAVAVADRSECHGRMPDTIHSVADRIGDDGGRALAVPCDITDETAVETAVAATVAEFGGIDILIANTGALWLGSIESTPLWRWQQCLDTNLTGVFLVTKAVIPHVRARGGGALVAMTTSGGANVRGANAYRVSKAATEHLYLGLAAELKADNIAVNCLGPSRLVLTESWLTDNGESDLSRSMIGTLAAAATFLAGQDGTGITGTIQRPEALAARRAG